MTNTHTSMPISRVWFITGCASGFGRAFAEAVLTHGDRLVATARRVEQIQDLAQSYPQQTRVVALDVTHADEVRAAVDAAMAAFGQIDVLVNNAGYGLTGAIEEVSDAEARQEFETNVFGVLNVTRAVLPHMRERRRGHIINISSIAGVSGSPGLGIYSGTKFAIEGISEALSGEVEPLGLHVTIVEPGGFRTNWAGSSMAQSKQQISDYAASSGRVRQALNSFSGHQAGDPKRAAQALIEVVQAEHPPLHLALGEDAFRGIRNKLARVEQDLITWQDTTLSTSFR